MYLSFERSLTASRRIALPVAACLATALILLPPGASAETKPAAKAPAAAAPATAAEPSPAELAEARELVVASGMTRSFNAAIPQLIKRLDATYSQTRPDLEPDLHNVLEQLRPEFEKRTDEMVDKAAHIFARLLSEQDIKAAVAFFETPAGKKYVETQPYFFDDVVNAMQNWHDKVEADLLNRLRAEMKKKGHKF